ncbi:cupin domain-containing protein [Xylella taiwanensis]|uniref:Cupin domain-containing protein n=1 Tax=Xylella taiwanensis TaxID=1444770 RepID=Z9JGC4_9GAMM|nr:cupin domain-containing protein [Xylella taiwanensis]AXI83826.1 transcriptional regulator [Xylella taiwanensis]EWS77244.1 transcriptional regulator [Xylella taiwanensis]MCD8456927.1 cupin domain-containing protein [Xylella taiwanensis]MCD8459338.1 cupin domain-containing protein [Xylella taiwanensis]MCD8461791.1 cupin domain-containing protein [Xylella taiwanensis]
MKRSAPLFPFEIQATDQYPLGILPEDFLHNYWHKRPLLIRNAFPDFHNPVTPEDLAGLACEEDVLSRLIRHDRNTGAWEVRNGPFQEEEFPGLPDHDWTLLVQDVDKWDPDVHALLEHFRFLPRWRIDDIMISFATTNGSVGAHVDHYDVFLLQGQGHRRWQIDASVTMGHKAPPLDFRNDVDIKLLRHFDPTHEWVLAPGDMLYLPPLVPHHGIAEDPCLTYSVGMRAPSSAELVSDWLDTLISDADETVRYHDADLKRPNDPYEIDAAAMHRAITALNALRMHDDPDRLGSWFGRFITTYRTSNTIAPYTTTPHRETLEHALAAGGDLIRHPWSRTAWCHATRGAKLFCSGLEFTLTCQDAQRLAAAERVDIHTYTQLSDRGRTALLNLVAQGHYHMDDNTPDKDANNQEASSSTLCP